MEKIKDPFIVVKSDYNDVKIVFEDILYIQGLKDYVKIYITEKPVITHSNLKNFELRLPVGQFIRVHKSYIVQLKKIQAIHEKKIILAGKEIPIGEKYKDVFFQKSAQVEFNKD
jgi:two-component system, LytTR family, response regulator